MAEQLNRRVPVGAEAVPGQGVHFRVWAPEHKSVYVVIAGDAPLLYRLDREPNGYFSGLVPNAKVGALYKYRLDGSDWYPDVASRFQPQGPHEYSQVIDPDSFAWTRQRLERR